MSPPLLPARRRPSPWTRVGVALASPLGVLIAVPGLVLGVGAFMAATGQSSLRASIDTLAEARFADRAQTAASRTMNTLGQADPLLAAWREFLDSHGGAPDRDAAGAFLDTLMRDRRGISFVFYGDADGDLLGAYRDADGELLLTERRAVGDGPRALRDYRVRPGAPPALVREEPDSGYDVRRRPYYRLAVERDARAWTDPYVFYDSGLPGVTCAEPYRTPAGDFRGVIGVDFNVNELSGTFEQLNTLPGGRIFLFAGDGTLLAYPGAEREFRTDQRGEGRLLTAEALDDAELDAFLAAIPSVPSSDDALPHVYTYRQGDETVLASVTPCRLDGRSTWYVGAFAPESAFMAPAHAHAVSATRIAVIGLSLALLVAALFAWHLVRSRHEVARARAAARAAREEVRELGSYRLVRKLGEGGMGEVWLGEHQLLARPAAVKLVHGSILDGLSGEEVQAVLDRFEQEARVTATLSSPNTVRLYDFGVSRDGVPFYVMELLEGLDLDELVKRHGPQPAGRVIHVLRQICSSLAEAHDKGLVHRDIKPGNVFLCLQGDEGDVVKVMDFGLVHVRDAHQQEHPLEKVTGTPAYMAPEHCMGETDLDGRTDLYAVGCLGYWLLTGRPVFERESPVEVMRDHVATAPEPPSTHAPWGIPEGLEAVVMRCLSKDPWERHVSARDLRDALDAVEIPAAQRWDEQRIRAWWEAEGPAVRARLAEEPGGGAEDSRRLERGATGSMPLDAWISITAPSPTVRRLPPR